MTLKQILAVLWRAKWMILAIVVVSVVVAYFVVQQQHATYSSSATARTSQTVANSASTGELGGLPIDADPSSIVSPAVLKLVAEKTGDSVGTLSKAIEYETEPGESTTRFVVTATGPTPAKSRQRADAVMDAYSAYLTSEIQRVLGTLTERRAAANDRATQAQAAALNAPENLIIASQLTTAIAALDALDPQIAAINDAAAPVTVLDAAEPGVRLGTSPTMILLIAGVAALIVALGIALIRDQFDDRLRDDDDVERLTGLPTIGAVSLDRTVSRGRGGESLPAASRRRTAISEDLRALRTSLQVVLPRQHAVLVVTSIEPGDGKSFIAANLAVTWARTGRSVILVAGDLRRPSLHGYFDEIDGRPGLADLLESPESGRRAPSNAAILASLVASEHPNLALLPPGTEPHDPADLLAGPATAQVFESLRDAADLVIIDSPPAMAITDPSLLAAHADGVVVVAAVRRTHRENLIRTVETLQANDAPVLGVIANRARRRLPKSYSPYYVQRPDDGRAAAPRRPASYGADEPLDGFDDDDRSEWRGSATGRRAAESEDRGALQPPEGDQPSRLP